MATTCIIVPCYNEATRLPVQEFIQYQQTQPSISFCFVDDGSQDNTLTVLQQLCQQNPAQNEVISLPTNQGKAGAVRAGMLAMTNRSFAYLGYFDADLATPLTAITDLQAHLDRHPQRELVMGSRIKFLGTDIQRNAFRHYVGRIIATVISSILRVGVYDSQCGAKLFRQGVVSALFHEPFISPWLFDVEILARLVQHHGRATLEQYVAEQPLNQWIEQSDSRISPTYAFRMWIELYRIHRTYRQS